ncbi:hypothetical protein EHW97_11050 [Aeromicrobium camelliae]|uniref:Uncharacterized protein n=2 Tax=Aeromicrobium camelliae TaxID=1538144 RepID=A0A3N6WNZ5_9ACTN|nr:hypothetical protein EHW97_11050 [Aeromicrobium camelliae]
MYLIYLTALGALGVVAWTTTIWATVKGKRWVRMVAPAILALAASVALFNVFVEDTSGDTGLPPLLSWIGVGPCLPGLAACVLLWRSPSRRSLR